MRKPIKYFGIAITSLGAVLGGLFFLGKRRKERKQPQDENMDLKPKSEPENKS